MRYISLFSGIGGFDLGFDRAGMQCAMQVERDKNALSVLSKHWPNVPKLEDVHEVTTRIAPAIDLICGGFPCQDVSVAGKRKGLAGERSGLWFEFRRIIDELKPGWVVIENVPGLLSSNGGRDMGTIVGNLAEFGYWWAYRVLDAQYYGVPQRRRRVFIVASLGTGSPQEVLFEPESSPWDTPPRRETRSHIAAATQHGFNNFGIKNIAGALSTSGQRIDDDTETFIANTFNGDTGGADDNDAQGNHLVTCFTPWDNQTKRIHNPALPAPTLAGSDGGGGQRFPYFATQIGVRRLTPLECERLQGFPDGWTAGQSDSARYRQLGNAVAVPVAYWLGHRITRIAQYYT